MGPRGPGEVSGARACVQIRPQVEASPSEGLLEWMVCRIGAYSSFNCISHASPADTSGKYVC